MGRLTIFKYERIEDGEAIAVKGLREEVERAWPNHQTYIDKVLNGLGLEGWLVRFSPCRYRLGGSGSIAKNIKFIAIESHTKNEMLITFLHEVLHYRNPGGSEEEIEERSIAWFKAINGTVGIVRGG